MSAEAETTQTEAQASQVELMFRREQKRENKTMDDKLVAPKLNPNLIVRVYDSFAHSSVRVATPTGEPILSGEYP